MAAQKHTLLEDLIVPPHQQINLKKEYDPSFTGKWEKSDAAEAFASTIPLLAQLQDKLYAQSTYALLIILQGLDAGGKDATIKHVMSGLNPQGVQVSSFKAPAGEELAHDYLWRNFIALPRRGHIGIFNRSYYEEVLIVRVHPPILESQRLPPELKDKKIWMRRFEEINAFEKYLVHNGIVVLKFFLNISKDEQKKRFLERVELQEKNWKFSGPDLRERRYWDDYLAAYEDMLNHTSTKWAPWYIIPANHKWFTRLAVSTVIHQALSHLNLTYPNLNEENKRDLLNARKELEKETEDQTKKK